VIHSDDVKVDWSLLLRMMVYSSRGMHFRLSSKPPILRRDLKNVNLLIDADWRCKVLDFGLSKVKGFREDQTSRAWRSARTHTPKPLQWLSRRWHLSALR
jgi:serine/threonine protein kinase